MPRVWVQAPETVIGFEVKVDNIISYSLSIYIYKIFDIYIYIPRGSYVIPFCGSLDLLG